MAHDEVRTEHAMVIEPPRVRWGAVFIGAVVACTVGLTLNLVGIALGLQAGAEAMEPEAAGGSSVNGLSGLAAAWLAGGMIVALAAGGYVGTRAAAVPDRSVAPLHGVAIWAVAFLIAAVIGGTAVSGGTVALLRGVGDIGAPLVTRGAEAVAQGVEPRAIAERIGASLSASGDPQALSREQRDAEVVRLLAQRVTDGQWTADQRSRAEAIVASVTGLDQAAAAARLREFEGQAVAAAERAATAAREAATASLRAASQAAFWGAVAMVIGLGAAVVGSWLAARARPGEPYRSTGWREPAEARRETRLR